MSNFEMSEFEHDLKQFFKIYDQWGLNEIGETSYWESLYFNRLVLPMLCPYLVHKEYGHKTAQQTIPYIEADDWRMAANDWLQIRADKRAAK